MKILYALPANPPPSSTIPHHALSVSIQSTQISGMKYKYPHHPFPFPHQPFSKPINAFKVFSQAFKKLSHARTSPCKSIKKSLLSLQKHDSTRKNHDHEFQILNDVLNVLNQELLKFDLKTQVHEKDKKGHDKGY